MARVARTIAAGAARDATTMVVFFFFFFSGNNIAPSKICSHTLCRETVFRDSFCLRVGENPRVGLAFIETKFMRSVASFIGKGLALKNANVDDN